MSYYLVLKYSRDVLSSQKLRRRKKSREMRDGRHRGCNN